jgi:dTDP-4-dehydrorhamnose reductase
MRILITGAEGMLGSNLCVMYAKSHEVIATGRNRPIISGCDNRSLDITSTHDARLISELAPDLVVHCAALTNVDQCEREPELARQINALGAEIIAKEAKKAGAACIHISTDAVFDGEKGGYSEADEPHPIQAYGKSKLEAERLVASHDALIVRTCIYGWNRKAKQSLAEWMISTLEKGEKIQGWTDIRFSPILVNNLGDALLELHAKGQKRIIHVAGSEGCSKFEFACAVARVFGLDARLIRPTLSSHAKLQAPRAKDLTLNVTAASGMLSTRLLGIRAGLEKMCKLRDEGFLDELRKAYRQGTAAR